MGFEVSDGAHDSGRPRLYRRPMPLDWWLRNGAYFRFVVRELTCVFVGLFAVLSLWQIRALAPGAEEYARFVERLGAPAFVALSGVALVAVLYHAVTFLNLTPTIIVIRIGQRRVPGWVIAGAHYAAAVVLSGVVAWILLRG